jgi:hypothetical protein
MFRAADISPDRYPALSPRDTMNTTSGIVAPKLGMIRLHPNYASAFCHRGIAKLKIKEVSGKADVAKARQLDASICQ